MGLNVKGKSMRLVWTRNFVLRFSLTLGPWLCDSCVLVFLGGVCVCESLFLIFILGVTTNYWFCIKCNWSPRCLIHFKLPN